MVINRASLRALSSVCLQSRHVPRKICMTSSSFSTNATSATSTAARSLFYTIARTLHVSQAVVPSLREARPLSTSSFATDRPDLPINRARPKPRPSGASRSTPQSRAEKERENTIIFDRPAVPNYRHTQRLRRKVRTRIAVVLAVLALGVGLYEGVPEVRYGVVALKRCAIIGSAVVLDMLDYRKVLNGKYASREEEVAELSRCHKRSAQRVLAALRRLGGIYIKLGQHMSAVILLPSEWTSTLRPLQDQCMPTPLPELRKLFVAETGKDLEDLFSEFDPEPIGVASLAQVHIARDKRTGEKLAVKIMHPEVEEFSKVDLITVNALVRIVKWAFPQFEFTWLAEEMNENLPLEMNFRHEAENAQRAQRDFRDLKKTSLYIPEIKWDTRRVLAMEYIEGARIDSLPYLAEHNIDRNRVSQELAHIFNRMLYITSFWHADSHPGNLLIRPAPPGSRSPYNFEIVLLDHGLYFDMDASLRVNYAKFWLSLILPPTEKTQKARRHYAKLIANIDEDMYPILESALTGRAGLEGTNLAKPTAAKRRAASMLDLSDQDDEEADMIRRTVLEKEGLFVSILDLLRRVPRRMLMVLKLNDLTRNLDHSLHTTHGPARIFLIVGRYCSLAVWRDDLCRLQSRLNVEGLSLSLIGSFLGSWWNFVSIYHGLRFVEAISDLRAGIEKTLLWLKGLRKGREGARRAAAGLATNGTAEGAMPSSS